MRHLSKRRAPCAWPAVPSLAVLVLLGASGCGSSNNDDSGNQGETQNAESSGDAASGSAFIEDVHQGGSGEPHLAAVSFGRLVDVYSEGADGVRRLEYADFVVGAAVASDGIDLELEVGPLTRAASLSILHAAGSADFGRVLAALEASVERLPDVGAYAWGEIGEVPRDAALVLHFDDLMDAESISAESIRVLSGAPAVLPFEARVLADLNHGGLVDGAFHPTRAIVDTTAGMLDVEGTALAMNLTGLPAGDVELRLATGNGARVTNVAGRALAGPADTASPGRDVVRRLAVAGSSAGGGGGQALLGDMDAPRIVGTQIVTIVDAPRLDPFGNPNDFYLTRVDFLSQGCAHTPSRGDIVQQPGFIAEVTEDANPHSGGSVFRLRVRLRAGNPQDWIANGAGTAQILAPYDVADDAGREGCFLEILPLPQGFPSEPTVGLSTVSTIGVRFNEPIASDSVKALETSVLKREAGSQLFLSDFVVGQSTMSLDQRSLTFVPALPLAHVAGVADDYFFTLAGGDFGPQDLAGNNLLDGFAEVELTVAASEPEERNGGRLVRFTSSDEEPPFGNQFGPNAEFSGQHLYDLALGEIRPRPVVRFEAVADRTQSVPGVMIPFPAGAQTPLVNLGAKLQKVWRYVDVGMSLTDLATYNLDVEGLNWAPLGGQVIADTFQEFEIRLSHGKSLPDEYLDPGSLFPAWPLSGLKDLYADNELDADRPVVVHPRFLGYTISPGDLFSSSTGTQMMPYPLNEGAQTGTYTWRDTGIQTRAGALGAGADPQQLAFANGQTPGAPFFSAGEVRSVGLPLLMEFRTFPDGGALGLNAFDVSLAANTSTRPHFRAFSAGGFDQSGVAQLVDPDLETQANGGFNRNSNPPGAPTPGLDNAFYIGSMDLVVRVSRSYSVWFPASDSSGGIFSSPSYVGPSLMQPSANEQPAGTEVQLAYRGATVVQSGDALSDATTLDGYGDHYSDPLNHDSGNANQGIAFLGGDESWTSDLARIDGAPYHQIRITALGNVATNETPALSALGTVWTD